MAASRPASMNRLQGRSRARSPKPASGLNLALGGWLFASAWMFGYGTIGTDACNSVVVGALIFTTGLSAVGSLLGPALDIISLVSGLWTVASPWIFGYAAAEPAMWNSILVGTTVALLALRRGLLDARSSKGE